MYDYFNRFIGLLFLFIVMLILRGVPACAQEVSRHEVQINGVVIDMMGKEPAVPDILQPKVNKGPRKWIVKFTGPIRVDEKTYVENLGCRFHDYLPDFAFLATMNDDVKTSVTRLPYIKGVVRFKPAYKLNEKLRGKAAAQPTGEVVRVNLKLDDPVSLRGVLAVVQKLKGRLLDVGHDSIRVEIDTAAISELAALEEVSWIDEHFDMQILNDTTRWVIQSYVPGDTRIWDHGIHGEGQIVGIGDTGLDYDMPWFSDQIGTAIGPGHRKVVGYDTTYGDDYDADYPGHGTHVSGTVAGDRTTVDGSAIANGMAPKAKIFIQDLTPGASNYVFPPNDLGLMFITAYNGGARFHTNSWGNSDSSYNSLTASADRFLWEHKEFLVLFSNGNSGPGVGTVGNPANAKNVISVGATYNGSAAENMASFSSNGPTADGRIKPTVTAPGYAIISADSDGLKDSFNSGTIAMSGTSMATPAVTGAAALIRQYFTDGFYPFGAPSLGNGFIPSAALVKATMINSAQEMTGSGTGGHIPATGQGWGRIDLANALPFAEEAGRFKVVEENSGLVTGGNWSGQFTVPGGRPLKVTLAWTDYPGAPGASKAIVNDLDLVVGTPDGKVLTGNAFANGESVTGGTLDRLNVEEQVLIKAPVPGTYTVSVSGYNVPYGPQPFAIAITGTSWVTSKGTITFDRQRYSSRGTLQVQVTDKDLNTNPALAEQITLQVMSTTEPTGERFLLTETAPNSAIFSASFPLATAPSVSNDGRLQVANGDTITSVYLDANDGSGKAATVTAIAVVDDAPPVNSNITITNITDTTSTIAWDTDEPASTMLEYGESSSMGGMVTDKRLTTKHIVELKGLREAAGYYVAVSSTDEAGNTAVSNAFFSTQSLPPSLTGSSSEGSVTNQSSTVISGISADPSGVISLTVNGTPASYRSSDGYYNLTVQLQVGSNSFNIASTDSLGNTASLNITVTRLPPPDLYMQACAGPQSAAYQSPIMITDTVCNNGPGDAVNFQVGFYLSSDQTLSSGDIFIGSRNVTSILGVGACSSGTTQVSVPTSVPGGLSYLIAYADYKNVLVEKDENNNILAGNQISLPLPALVAPYGITVPATNTTGTIYVYWTTNNASGIGYTLEYSKDGAAWTTAYSGPARYVNFTVTANGSYRFRVKAVKTGYADSAYTTSSNSCIVTRTCTAPYGITVPTTNTTGTIYVYWTTNNASGIGYTLEYSKDGAAWTTAYSGPARYVNFTVTANGSYGFRVKAVKTGYADSAYTTSRNSCIVTLR